MSYVFRGSCRVNIFNQSTHFYFHEFVFKFCRQNSASLRRRTCSHTVWPHDGSPWQRDNFDVWPGQLRHFLSPCPWQKHRLRCSSWLKNMAKLSKETKQRLQQLFQCGQFVIRWGFIPTVLYLGQYLRRKQWETRVARVNMLLAGRLALS